jgi:hypothetical protein
LSSFACGNGSPTLIGPSTVTTNERFVSRSVSVIPTEVTALAVPASFCPFGSPFLAPVTLVIHAGGPTDLRFDGLQGQFFGSEGTQGPITEINSVQLSNMFGSTIIPAFGTRSFPVSFPFGCVGGQTGTLFLQVGASDLTGQRTTTPLQVNVR